MKPLLLVVLAASLAANVLLALRTWRSAPENVRANPAEANASAPASVADEPVSAAGRKDTAADPGSAATWKPVSTDQDLQRLVSDLRAAGYPPRVVRAIVRELLNVRYQPRDPLLGQPFWKQARPSPEMVAARNALENEKRGVLEQLLGPDAAPSATIDPVTRERRYGTLPDAKVDAVARIERDYDELGAEAWAARRGNVMTSQDTLMQTQRMMEQEKLADLAKVLSPEELQQYALRNSQTAQNLMHAIGNLDLTPAEFSLLYESQRNFEAQYPAKASMTGAEYTERQAALLKRNESLRAALGDARFLSYLEASDHSYANVAKSLPQQPPATSYQIYQMQVEMMQAFTAGSTGGAPSPERIEQMRKLAEGFNARLDALLGADAAAAFRKTPGGGVFNSFRPPAAKAKPAGG